MRRLISLIALAFTSVSAQADNGWYLQAFGGATFQDGQSGLGEDLVTGDPVTVTVDFDLGFAVGGAVGYRFGLESPGSIRTELELGYRENPVSDTALINGELFNASADNSSIGIFANIIYELDDIVPLVTPYAGGGIGAGGVESDTVLSSVGLSANPQEFQFGGPTIAYFQWQILAGVGFDLLGPFELFVEGRFISAVGVDFDVIDEVNAVTSAVTDGSFDVFQVNGGLRLNF